MGRYFNYLVLIPAALLLSFVATKPSSKLRKGFEALGVYNYFLAKDLFYDALKKDSVAAAFGLSEIYGRDKNPFFDLDSAFKYSLLASAKYPRIEAKDSMDYLSLGIDSAALAEQLIRVDSLLFERVVLIHSIVAYDDYSKLHVSKPFRQRAIDARNAMAYAVAAAENQSEALLVFMQDYPDASEGAEAEKQYQKLLFEEKTKSGSVSAFKSFLKNFPESPYAEVAQSKIYERYTSDQTAASFVEFILENPDNQNVNRAWRNIYQLEVGDKSPLSIAAFSLKYPNYPFQNELKADFDFATTRFYPFSQDTLFGFIDEKGEVRIEPIFEWVEPFSEGLAAVGRNEKMAYVEKSGAFIIDFELDDGYAFKGGYAVATVDDAYGVIDRNGSWLIPADFDDIGEFNDSLCYVGKDGLYGYYNTYGKLAITLKYDDATDFSFKRAVVTTGGKRALINTSGRELTGFEFDWIEAFPDSIAPARYKLGDAYGLIDHNGKVLCAPLYERIGDFSEGLALATSGKRFGFIGVKADTIVPFSYDYSSEALLKSNFTNGYAPVYQKDKIGVINKKGEKIFPAIFEDVGLFEGELIAVKKKGSWGYANREVDLVIPYRFDQAETFRDSTAIVAKDGLFGAIDANGKYVLPMAFAKIERLEKGFLVLDSLFGILGATGDTLVGFEYDEAKILDPYVVRFTQNNGKEAYYDYRNNRFIWKGLENELEN